MMKFRKTAAFLLCLAMLTGTGCSISIGGSKSGGNVSYSSSTKKYDVIDFSFEASEDLDVEDTRERDGKINKYEFSGDGFKALEVMNCGLDFCTSETYIKSLERSITSSNEKKGKSDEFESAKLDIPGLNAAEIFIVNKDKEGEQGEAHVSLTSEGYRLLISATYDLDDKDSVKQLMEDIAKTVKYTGDFHLPTEPQTYDCDLFSITAGPEWYIKDTIVENEKERGIEDVRLRYYYAQDLEHFRYPLLTIRTIPEDKFNTVEKLIEKQEKNSDESKYKTNVERGKEEISGYQADTFSFDISLAGIEMRSKTFYFSANGFVYTISISVNPGAEEMNNAEIQTLLDGLTIKQLSEEEIEKKKQEIEAARYKQYTFHGASFRLDSSLTTRDDLDSSKTYAGFSSTHADMRISCDGSGKDVEDAVRRLCEENADYADLKKEKVTVGSNEFVCVSWTITDQERKAEVYLLNIGNKLWTFDFGIDESYCEEGKDIIRNFLESLDFSNAG